MSDKRIGPQLLLTMLMSVWPSEGRVAEPLPPRALARIGDHRFYHGPGISCIALSSDGRRAASAAHYPSYDDSPIPNRGVYDTLIILWDTSTGERLRELHVPQGFASQLVFSGDGKWLAVSYEITDSKSGVALFDVETGKLRKELGFFKGQIGCLQFSPDGKQLRVSEWGGLVSAWDAATGKQMRLWKPPASTMLHSGTLELTSVQGTLSPDGKTIVWKICKISRRGCPSCWIDGLRIHDAETNRQLYQKELIDWDEKSCHNGPLWSYAFTDDGKRLVADCNRLTVWATASGRELTTLKIPGMVRFALAPDGRRAAIEEDVANRRKSRLRLWDLETRKPLRELTAEFENSSNGFVRVMPVFSGDGKTLLLATDSTLRLFDARSGTERGVPRHRAPVTPRFLADGRTLFTSCVECSCRWNLSGEQLRLLSQQPRKAWEADCLAHSGDEQLCIDSPSKDHDVRVRETTTGRVLHELPEYAEHAVFSADAKRLLLYYVNSERYANFKIYDVKTGKQSGEIKRVIHKGGPIFSPDGRFIAWADDLGVVYLHDAVTGKRVAMLRPPRTLPKADRLYPALRLLFSSDGEQLIVTGHITDCSESGPEKVSRLPLRVFDVHDGREIARCYANPTAASAGGELSCMAWSPDKRLLAVAEKFSGAVRVLEITSGRTRLELEGHRHGIQGLAFAPDGQTLASGGEDNVVFLWDVTGTRTRIEKSQIPSDLSLLWNDLASEDGKRAGVAIASLLRKPDASVALLQEQLHPVKTLSEKRLAQWIADLDSDVFQTREAASRELTRLGERAEAALRRDLTNRPSLEMRRRIEVILEKLEWHTLPAETLRVLRAIEVLEHIGTPAARRCLEALAKGASEARPTRDAKAALQRLAICR